MRCIASGPSRSLYIGETVEGGTIHGAANPNIEDEVAQDDGGLLSATSVERPPDAWASER
jgi:hypothetical protein